MSFSKNEFSKNLYAGWNHGESGGLQYRVKISFCKRTQTTIVVIRSDDTRYEHGICTVSKKEVDKAICKAGGLAVKEIILPEKFSRFFPEESAFHKLAHPKVKSPLVKKAI